MAFVGKSALSRVLLSTKRFLRLRQDKTELLPGEVICSRPTNKKKILPAGMGKGLLKKNTISKNALRYRPARRARASPRGGCATLGGPERTHQYGGLVGEGNKSPFKGCLLENLGREKVKQTIPPKVLGTVLFTKPRGATFTIHKKSSNGRGGGKTLSPSAPTHGQGV